MKSQRAILGRLLPVFVILAGVGGFVAMGSRQPVEPKDEDVADMPLVEVVTTQNHDRGLTFEVDGVAAPYRELLLTSQVGGSIEFKAEECEAGQFVKKGTRLMEIDPRDYRLEVQRLTRELRQAEGNIKEVDVQIANAEESLKLAKEELELRRNELARVERLLGKKVGTDAEYDTVKRNELQAKNSRLTLENEIRLLGARRERLVHAKGLVETQLEKAELDLKRTQIVAPTDGVIVNDHVESGTYVQPGTTLVTLEDTSSVEVRCKLRMEELNWLWRQHNPSHAYAAGENDGADYEFPKTQATVIYELGGRRFTWDGVLSHYDGMGLDERSRTVPCRVFVENPREVSLEEAAESASDVSPVSGPPALVRGMFVSVKVHAFPNANLLSLPEKALRPGGEVWLVRDGKLDRCRVHVARVTPEGVLIDADRSELSAGDQVVTTPLTATPNDDGLGYIEEGKPVRVKPATDAS